MGAYSPEGPGEGGRSGGKDPGLRGHTRKGPGKRIGWRQKCQMSPLGYVTPYSGIHLFQSDSQELRGFLAMLQSTTLQGQAGLSQELYSVCRK